MSTSIAYKTRVGGAVRATFVAFIAASAVTAILISVVPSPAAAASTPGASIANGTLTISGTSSADRIALRLSKSHPNRLQVDFGDNGSADRIFRLGTFARIDVKAGSGNDRIRIDSRHGIFTNAKPTRIHGGKGNDTLIGGDGRETIFGDDGNDVIDGNGGVDTVSLGNGNDTFVSDPADGSDIVRGGGGLDTVVLNGSNDDENVTATANAGRVALSRAVGTVRDPGNLVLDLDDVEAVRVRPVGGKDEVTVNDLTGTDVARIDVDLAATLGGAAPDEPGDTVFVLGTPGNDTITVTASGATVNVDGLAAAVRITHSLTDVDKLALDTLGGVDTLTIDPAVLALIHVSGQ